MKDASPTLKTFLAARNPCVKANLYTITLSDGSTVLKWTDADIDLLIDGQTYSRMKISDAGSKSAVGAQVDTLSIDISAQDETVSGVPLIRFIRRNGLDGALIKVERAVYPNWGEAIVGRYTRFEGRFSRATDVSNTSANLTVASHTEVLNTDLPPDVYQGSCLNRLFDTNCGLVKASYKATGTVTNSPTPTAAVFDTTLTAAAAYYERGFIVFTSGANAGQRRAIKGQTVGGLLTLAFPLPAAPASGDAFDIYPGCDLLKATCSGKFNNLLRFRGQPFIPVPEAAI